MEWVFRLRFQVSPRSRIGIETHALDFESPVGELHFAAQIDDETTIERHDMLILRGTAPSEEEARLRGQRVLDALPIVLARLRVGADLGRLAPVGTLTQKGLEALAGSTPETPVLNDDPGLMVYPAEPKPRFARFGPVTGALVSKTPAFEDTVNAALESKSSVGDAERTAYDLFAVSFFESGEEARLISLVMAIETLLDPPERDIKAQAHVRNLMKLTRESDLPQATRDSMLGSLQWMLRDSISATGSRFVRDRLGERVYGDGGMAEEVWRHAYQLRSDLVDGAVPRPTRQNVGRAAANMEVLVAEVLSGDLLMFGR